MKTLIFIAAFLVTAATKLVAQESAIEIKRQQSYGTMKNDDAITNQGNHQFEIVANEEIDVNLKFNLKREDNLNVVVKDKNDRVVFTRRFQKEGENKVAFTMEEDEKYTVLLNGTEQSKLIVDVSQD